MNRRNDKRSFKTPAVSRPRVGLTSREPDGRNIDESIGTNASRGNQKHSTPNSDGNENPDLTMLSEISCIPSAAVNLFPPISAPSFGREGSSCLGVLKKPNTGAVKKTPKTKSQKEAMRENQLSDYSYNGLLQSIVLDKMAENSMERATDEIDEHLTSLQKRITENQEILNKTKEHIRKIEVINSMEAKLKNHKDNFKNIANNVNKVNNPKRNEAVVKELKKMRNKLACENIIIPESSTGIGELHDMMKDAITSFEKLPKEPIYTLNDAEDVKESLKAFEKSFNNITALQNRFSQNVPQVTTMVLENCSNKIHEEIISTPEFEH